MEWEVTLESADKNSYLIRCSAQTKEEASEIAISRIIDLGWLQYQYKVIKILNILKGEFQYGKEKN
jgi:hypothetical protein